MHSRARWYKHGKRKSKYFYNLEKSKQKKKHITSLVNNDGDKITNPKDILEEEERFLHIKKYEPNCPTFSEFFEKENALSEKIAKTCEGVMSVHECELVLKTMENNKSPGTDGLMPEFYRYFWNLLSSFMVSSLNNYYAFRNRTLSISQRQGIIS